MPSIDQNCCAIAFARRLIEKPSKGIAPKAKFSTASSKSVAQPFDKIIYTTAQPTQMRRDSIFYRLFQRSPTLLFELVPPPANAEAYRFDSVAVKEPKFEIDGVFLPPDDSVGTVYFCEIQMQKDKALYERLFAESALYFYRHRARFSDWQTEQSDIYPHRSLLNGEQVHRIYLDELGDIQQLPLWVGVMALTTVKKEAQAVIEAQTLLSKARELDPSDASRAIIEIVATIIWYRFEHLSRREIETMLDISVQESRVYQEGRQEGATHLLVRMLEKRFGSLSEEVRTSISALPLIAVEELSEALLEFSSLADLQSWLLEKKTS
jgi:predicted transposase/invertase (TIGR01784 family)